MQRFLCLLGAAALAVAVAAPAPASAQSDLAAQALIDRLRPTVGSGTRGLRLPAEPSAPVAAAAPSRPPPGPSAAPAAPTRTAVVVPRPAPVATEAPSVSITVTFGSASAVLTTDAERALAPLGRALSSAELAPYRFRIEGHTDSVGDPALNQTLSERRAAAVRDLLVRSYGVDPARLVAVGFGASQPVVAVPPQTPESRNRRVQVVNLGG